MLSVDQHNGVIEISDGRGRRVIVTEDDTTGSGFIISFPTGARTSGMAPFMFGFEEGELTDRCDQPFHLAVNQPVPRDYKHVKEDCRGCPE